MVLLFPLPATKVDKTTKKISRGMEKKNTTDVLVYWRQAAAVLVQFIKGLIQNPVGKIPIASIGVGMDP